MYFSNYTSQRLKTETLNFKNIIYLIKIVVSYTCFNDSQVSLFQFNKQTICNHKTLRVSHFTVIYSVSDNTRYENLFTLGSFYNNFKNTSSTCLQTYIFTVIVSVLRRYDT